MSDETDTGKTPTEISTSMKAVYCLIIIISLSITGYIFDILLRIVASSPISSVSIQFLLLFLFPGLVMIASIVGGIRLFWPHKAMYLTREGFKPLIISGAVCLILILIPITYFLNQPMYPKRIDSDSKSNLHNIFLGCKAYWAENGSDKECDVSIAGQAEYGYLQSSRVSIQARGTEESFSGTAQHEESKKRWSIDAAGEIQQLK